MQAVCQECHNKNWIDAFYEDADAATVAVNDWVVDSNEIMAPLHENGLLTEEPFDWTQGGELWRGWNPGRKVGLSFGLNFS